jgi:epidermal growth factor receptor substrate 15
MADEFTAAPSLNLTPEEKRVFGQLFREADKENIGVVTGEVAVKFFEKTRLEPRILGEVCTSRLSADFNRTLPMERS